MHCYYSRRLIGFLLSSNKIRTLLLKLSQHIFPNFKFLYPLKTLEKLKGFWEDVAHEQNGLKCVAVCGYCRGDGCDNSSLCINGEESNDGDAHDNIFEVMLRY